jgi:hypothetical protein
MEFLDNIKRWTNSDLQRDGNGLFQDPIMAEINFCTVFQNVTKCLFHIGLISNLMFLIFVQNFPILMGSTHISSSESPRLEQCLINNVLRGFLQHLEACAGVKAILVTSRGDP